VNPEIPEATLQKIAREFNFSETVFVYPPEDPEHTARVRIFTPTMEIPFAGHPTIGTAVSLAHLGAPAEQTLELGVGPLRCRVEGTKAQFTPHRPLERMAFPAVDLVAACLSLSPDDIVSTTHPPVQASLGLPFVLVELKNEQSVSGAQPEISSIRTGAALHPAGLDFAVFCYARTNGDVFARMFAPLDNIPEDPATGSAAATLCALLSEALSAPQSLHIRQGVDMGRPSRITATSRVENSLCTGVTISGNAVQSMQGRLLLPD